MMKLYKGLMKNIFIFYSYDKLIELNPNENYRILFDKADLLK